MTQKPEAPETKKGSSLQLIASHRHTSETYAAYGAAAQHFISQHIGLEVQR